MVADEQQDTAAANPGLALDESDRVIVGTEARALAAAFQDQERRVALQHLATEADEGEIPGELIADLEWLLDLGLQTGRFRGRYGPGGETAMLRLFGHTPRGGAIASRVSATNSALRALRGQSLEQVNFSPSGWGSYTLLLKTDQTTLRLSIDATGVQAAQLEVGG